MPFLVHVFALLTKPVRMIQDPMAHGSHGMFTQAGYNDPSQDESSQMHYGMAAPGPLQSQVVYLFPCVQFSLWLKNRCKRN